MSKGYVFGDVILRAGNVSFSVHSYFLGLAMPYLTWVLKNNGVGEMFVTVNENAQFMKEITLTTVDPDALKSLIDFAYGTKLNITMANAKSLLDTSLHLWFDKARDRCLRFLYDSITHDNALAIRAWCDFANNGNFIEKIDRFIRANFEDISRSEEFLNISFAVLTDFISRNDLNVLWEDDVLKCVIRWVEKSESERSAYLPDLLRHVRFHCIRTEYLENIADAVRSQKLFYNCCFGEVLIKQISECLTRRLLNPHGACPETAERFCIENHHLKCAKRIGYGMYAVCQEEMRGTRGVVIKYHDHINGMWTTLCSIKRDLYFDCLSVEEEKIYFANDSEVCIFNLRELKLWTIGIETPSLCGKVLHCNKIYLFGGHMNYKTVKCLDLQNISSSVVGTIMCSRLSCSFVSLGSEIYLIGGHDPKKFILNSVEKYNTLTNMTCEVASMLIPRCAHFCTAIACKIYSCGGTTGPPVILTNSCEVYDPVINQWRYIRGSVKFSRFPTSLFSFDEKLYLFGREEEHSTVTEFCLDCYNSSEDDWEDLGFVLLPGKYNFATIFQVK